ncbi:MAG: BatA domain-containing protein [Planctomycetia bacterium]|nr:BatA domain-containing protein [Planctomycetia bacterium]
MLTWLAGLFASPWMLAWLPLAAAPVLIHLWNRRKYRQVTWAAMEYLLAAMARSSRRMRIEQWLLLAVRTLALLLAVLAISQPLLRPLAGRFAPGAAPVHHVLVLDGSYSMTYKPADKSLFDAARQQARELVDAAREGDAFTLVLMCDAPRVIIGHASFDRAAVVREIDALAPPEAGANVPASLEAAERLVRETQQQYPQLGRPQIHYFTDLGRNSWGADTRTPQVDREFRQRLARLDEIGAVEMLPIGAAGAENLAVISLTAADPYATIAQPVALQTVLRNFGRQKLTAQKVELWVNGQRNAQQTVDVPAGEASAPVNFSYRFPTPGDHIVEIRAPGDALIVDNRRFLSLPVKEHLRVLCISGQRGSTRYVMTSLDPDYNRESFSILQPQVAAESALQELDLKQFECVFLCNVGQFTSSEARVLEGYLKSGGGLVFFLGDQVVAESYNRELGGQTPGSPHVIPALLGSTVTREKYFFFDPLGYRHPLTEMWRANPLSGLLTAPVAKYFKLNVPKDSRAQMALAFNSGDPAIVEEQLYRGRSILVATAPSTSSVIDAQSKQAWTLFPTSPSFPPVVQALWRLAVGGQIQHRNADVGQPLGGALGTVRTGSGPTVALPGSHGTQPTTADPADPGRWSFADTDHSGVYTVELPGRREKQKFAVNVDTRESDLTRVHEADLPRGFTSHGSAQRADEAAGTITIGPPRGGLHRTLLCIVLGLLIFESGLAWWLGSRAG